MKALVVLALLGTAIAARAADWPRELNSPEGLITLYQPQIGSYVGDSMNARAAVSVVPDGQTEPMFGAVWLVCHVLTDRPTRTVKILDLKVKRIKFPNRTKAETAAISSALERQIPQWDLTFSLDELLESLETAQKGRENARDIDLSPPKIIVMEHPGVLILIDGNPDLAPVEGTNLSRVVNTPYFIVQDGPSGRFYLRGGSLWYSSMQIGGPWQVTDAPPEEAVNLSNQAESDDSGDQAAGAGEDQQSGKIPEIVVSTVPAELIASDGPLQFTRITGTGLLYASNTPSKLFMEIVSQTYYVLISGRWYTSEDLEGPWTYVASDKLPADFARIPPGSDRDAVLASVAGTIPAKEAVLDAQIPQTAEVDLSETTNDVQYDGDPQFEPIENTTMEYAVNTSTPVIMAGGRYYACDNGVWFDGGSPQGPWGVCVSVPSVIYTIPPRCPVYYVRYVRVYGHTSRVAYVGYTSGYTGCYVYNHTVVYGTGYAYRPWYRRQYYSRPATWGFGVHYEPWTGWSFGYATGWWRPQGWFAYNEKNVHPGWWGPTGYRPEYHPVAGPVYRKGYHPVYRPVAPAAVQQPPAGGAVRSTGNMRGATLYDRWTSGVRRPATGTMPRSAAQTGRPAPRQPVYPDRRPETPQAVTPPPRTPERQEPVRVAPPATVSVPRPVPRPEPVHVAPAAETPVPRPVPRDNNVYATPDGNIVRKTPQGWQQRDDRTWKPTPVPPAETGVSRDAAARQRGAERASSFTTPPPPPPAQVRTPPPPPPPSPPQRPVERKPEPPKERGKR